MFPGFSNSISKYWHLDSRLRGNDPCFILKSFAHSIRNLIHSLIEIGLVWVYYQ